MTPQPHSPPSFWRGLVRYDASKVNVWLALRNAVGISLPLAVGVALGRPDAGLMACIGALDVAYSDGTDPYRYRARRMLTASILVALAVFVGAVCGHQFGIKLAVVAACAFGAGMMVAVSPTATDIGNITAVTLIVFAAHPLSAFDAAQSGLAALLGGLFQTGLALTMWALNRYAPERRALSALYRALARSAEAAHTQLNPAADAPADSQPSTAAQQALAGLGGNPAVEAERYLALLSQAERIRLALMSLTRIRIRLHREAPLADELRHLDHALTRASSLLDCIARSIETGVPAILPADMSGQVSPTAESLRHSSSPQLRDELRALLADARAQLDALAGQLRSALELAAHLTPQGLDEFERQQSSRPWSLRLTGAWAVLRANLNVKSGTCRHAIRLAVSVSAAELLALSLGLPRGYWAAMTAAIILRPDFTSTFSRGVLRAVGTLIGLALTTAFFHFLAPSIWWQVALLAALAYVLRAFGPANYGVFAISLTALIVLLLAVTGIAPGAVILARGWNTLAGAAIALAAYALWPTWERFQVPDELARMLDAYRVYFQAVRDGYYHPEFSARENQQLDRARLAARLARSNLEASVARLRGEPGTPAESVRKLDRILANSHRFIHAVMSLDAGLLQSRPATARPPFRTFSDHTDLTLYYLAASLRGSSIDASALPDLREDHHRLIESGDPHIERYAFVNVETDRITNSLNTLAGEILDWEKLPSSLRR